MAKSGKEGKPIWDQKHLLGLETLSRSQIVHILDTAVSFKDVSTRSVKKVPALRGKVVVNLFFEDSTRTRTSFSLAASRLSADVIEFSAGLEGVYWFYCLWFCSELHLEMRGRMIVIPEKDWNESYEWKAPA